MKKIPVFFFLLLSLSAFSQDIPARTDSLAVIIQQLYNAKQYSQVHQLGNADFQKAISESQLADFFTSLQTENGSLYKLYPLSFKNGTAQYQALFEKKPLNMFLTLDGKGKIAGLFFRPAVEQKTEAVLSKNPLKTDLDKKVDALIRPYIQKSNTVGIVVGVLRGKKMQFYSYGETKKGSKNLPDKTTIFEIGSISKTFTAALLAISVQNKLLRLEDEISKWLPDSIPHLDFEGTPVLIKQLSNHTSGLPRLPANLSFQKAGYDPQNPYKNYTNFELFTYLKNFKTFRKPGLIFEYSNLAVGLLGTIVEKVNKKPYQTLLIEQICKPLKLKDTRIQLTESQKIRLAQGYNDQTEAVSGWDFQALAGAGAIHSTAQDLLKYAQAQMNTKNKKLKSAFLLCQQVTFEQVQTKIGLGWFSVKAGDKEVFFHNGGTGGFRSSLYFDPTTQTAVVLLTNAVQDIDREGQELLTFLMK